MNTLALILALTAVLLTVVDFLQTLVIASNPLDDYHEKNVILGRDPTPRKVCVYFACCLVAEVVGAALMQAFLPVGVLCFAAGVVTAVEFACVRHNYATGIRIG